MELDLLILEVDGSLANPYAAGAVAVWTAILSAIAVVLARQFTSSGRHRLAWAVGFTVALLATRRAQWLIGELLYSVVDLRITGVGFWGGPPVWIAPVISCSVGTLVWSASRHPDGTRIRSIPVLLGALAALLTALVGLEASWRNAVEAERFASIQGVIEKGMSDSMLKDGRAVSR